MRTLLLLLLLTQGADWSVLKETQDAVLPISIDKKTACTAWRYKPGYYVTVAHCTTDAEDKYLYTTVIDGIEGSVLKRDVETDLAVVYIPVEKLKGPVLKLARASVRLGEPVAALGYAAGLSSPLYTFGSISRRAVVLPGPNGTVISGLLIYGGFIQGMSGGPVLNRDGWVVSMCKGTGPPYSIFQDLAVGIPQATLRAFLAGVGE